MRSDLRQLKGGGTLSKASYRWVTLFAVILLVSSAASVFAAELPAPTQEDTLPPSSEDVDPSRLPGSEDVSEAIEDAEREEEEREAWLASPAAVHEREDSRFAFSGLGAAAARELLSTVFAEQLAQLNADPTRVLSDARLRRISDSETSATVRDDGNALLLESSLPVRTEAENGDLHKVDLSLEEKPYGYETENALVEVQIPKVADEPIKVGEEGVSIGLVGANEDRIAEPFGDENALVSEVLPDTDMLISPIATGVEVFNLLRSESSPETLRFQVGMPPGAELRADGEWGAEVVKDGELLTTIREPVAVDAQGTDVPVNLQVKGDYLLLTVDHREGDYAMPILLDPILENNENWIYGQNHNALDMGIWAFNKNVAGMYGSTYCIYECFGPGGSGTRGLYVSSQSGTYWPNQFAQWAYSAPNIHSYISSVTLGTPYVRADHGCSGQQYPQPHDYFGVWSVNLNAWVYISVGSANYPGGNYTLPFSGDAVIFGLGSGGGQFSIGCWRDLYAGGAHIWLDDWARPTLSTSSSDQWMDTSPIRLNVSASDEGLGVQAFETAATTSSGSSVTWWTEHSCTGDRRSRCPNTWNLGEGSQPMLNFNPSVLPEGIRKITVTAYDVLEKPSTTASEMTVRIDHAAPTITLSGTLTEQATLGAEQPNYTIKAEAKDGVPGATNADDIRSGAASLIFENDGQIVSEYKPGCPTQSCSMFRELKVPASELSDGSHTLTVKATDALGHVATKHIDYTTGDSLPPTLDVNGFPEASLMSEQASHTASFGTGGTGNGQFDRPGDLTVAPDGDIWVADSFNNRIQRFDSSGTYLGKFGSTGTGNGKFERPRGIEFDAAGNIWVLDSMNNRLQKFNEAGQYLSKWGAYGTSNGQLKTPKSFAIDAEGNFWVADTLNGRIQKFSASGTFLKVAGTSGPGDLTEPMAIDTSAEGDVFVADWEQNRVVVFNSAGEYERSFGVEGDGNGEFNHPGGLNIDAQGDVWVADSDNNRIQQFDQQGHYIAQFGSYGTGDSEMDLTSPIGIATDAEGSVWVTDSGNDRVQEWEFIEQPSQPTYAASFGSEGEDDGQLERPGDLAVAPDGDVWVADTDNHRIQRFDPDGDYVDQFGSFGEDDGQFDRPWAIEFDAAGDIWVLDSRNHRLQRFNQAGQFLAQWGSYGSSNGQLKFPKGLAIDAEGNFWVADTNNARIQ